MASSTPFVGDYYEILEVARDATTEEIKKQFRRLARECHPDVAGDDPNAAERFAKVREAYETLVDPVRRARYDRRGIRPNFEGGRWRPPGGFNFGGGAQDAEQSWRQGRRDPGNDLDLDDIFGDFGGMADFGFGDKPGGASASTGRRTQRRASAYGGAPEPGRDIHLQVDVLDEVARKGGVVTLHYPRLRRGDDGRTLYRYDEIYDLRVPPGTRHGDTLRVEKMGDAGANGGPFGDLVCDVRVVVGKPGQGSAHGRPWGQRKKAPEPAASPPADQVLPISVTEAILGGRVQVDTPTGPVRLTIPPGSSGGTRLRLRGRGVGGSDHYVVLRIVVPRKLDEESRKLIERFAELNPGDPRED